MKSFCCTEFILCYRCSGSASSTGGAQLSLALCQYLLGPSFKHRQRSVDSFHHLHQVLGTSFENTHCFYDQAITFSVGFFFDQHSQVDKHHAYVSQKAAEYSVALLDFRSFTTLYLLLYKEFRVYILGFTFRARV